jgi:hypothetical protein
MAELTNKRLTIRIGRNTLSFSMPDDENNISFIPYVVKSGVSMAANLRKALKIIAMAPRVRVLIDSQVLMVPIEQFDEQTMEQLHHHAFPHDDQDVILYNVLPDLNAVAVFNINRDLKQVVDDNFSEVRFITAISPVWRHLHQRSFTGTRFKLYGYFHESRLEVFSFQQNRFKFCNSFEANRTKDAIFFLLYVWKQLQYDNNYDELHLVGDIPDEEQLVEELKQYLPKVYVINPSADFNRAPVTEIIGMPYDLQTLFVKGR